MIPITYQNTDIYCEHWTAEQILQLFGMLRENKELKLTISFENGRQDAQKSKEKSLGQYLSRLGVARHLNGYAYLKTGLRHCLENPQELESITKLLYPAIAKEHQTTAGRVEHGIRHAITLAWEERSQEEWEKIFGFQVGARQGRPTNTEFLAALSDHILMEE